MKTTKKFAFDVGWVFAGSMAVLLLHFLQKPIMARFLGPAGMGLFSMVTTTVNIVALVAGLGISSAVVKYVAEYKVDRNKIEILFSCALLTMVVIGVAVSIVLFVLSDKISSVFNMPQLSHLLEIYVFIIPFSLTFVIINGLFNGLREMKYYSFFNFLNGIMIFIFIVTFLFLGFGIEGALLGDTLALIVVVIIASVTIKKFVHFRISEYKRNIKKLTFFGSQVMFGNIINNVNYQADTFLIAYFLTATDLGYYAVAVSLSRIFWRMPQSIQMVSYSAASGYWAKGEINSLGKMIDKSMKYTACFSLIVGMFLLFFSNEIIIFLYGKSFVPSIVPFQILLIGTVIFSIIIPVGNTLPAIGRPDLSLKINCIGAVVGIVLNIFLIPYYSVAGAAIASLISLTIVAGLSIYYIIKLTKINIDTKWYASASVVTLFAMALFHIGSGWINVYIIGFSILVIYIVVSYLFFLTMEDKIIFKNFIHSIFIKH